MKDEVEVLVENFIDDEDENDEGEDEDDKLENLRNSILTEVDNAERNIMDILDGYQSSNIIDTFFDLKIDIFSLFNKINK